MPKRKKTTYTIECTHADLMAFASIVEERDDQAEQWGEGENSPQTWALILSEEQGEFAQAVLNYRLAKARFIDGDQGGYSANGLMTVHRKNMRRELVQIAAVAVAAIRQIDEEIDELRKESAEQ